MFRRRKSNASGHTKSVQKISNITPASLIFRNLLILEDQLRTQLDQSQRLRAQYLSFYFILNLSWFCICGTIYLNLFNQIRRLLQFILVFNSVTIILFHLSGQYKRSIVNPRRFISNSNKGLRQFNLKLVKVPVTMDEVMINYLQWVVVQLNKMLLIMFCLPQDNYVYCLLNGVQKQLQDKICKSKQMRVKIVLSPRMFSNEVRSGWEIYRDEFWIREYGRREDTKDGKEKEKESKEKEGKPKEEKGKEKKE